MKEVVFFNVWTYIHTHAPSSWTLYLVAWSNTANYIYNSVDLFAIIFKQFKVAKMLVYI